MAVVTGASSGIGREIARAYAREGAKVVGVARREERLAALSEESANYAGEIAGFVADLSDREQTKQAIAFAQELYGPVDILVNNAGQIGSYSAVGRLDEDNWDYLVELNLNAPIFATKAVIEDMVENGGGAIINIASVGGIAGYFGVDYHTTKAALIAMTRQVAFSYSGKNIRCNAILPGGVKTEDRHLHAQRRPGVPGEVQRTGCQVHHPGSARGDCCPGPLPGLRRCQEHQRRRDTSLMAAGPRR